MKQWFPLTDYEFYAYLSSGLTLLVGIDYLGQYGLIVERQSWTAVQVGIFVLAAYLLGSVAAMFSATLIEHLLFSKVLRSPLAIQLGSVEPTFVERGLSAIFAQREYTKLPQLIISNFKALGPSDEDCFLLAHRRALADQSIKTRLDSFQNNYGFSRNLCFSVWALSGFSIVKDVTNCHFSWFSPVLFLFGVALLGRYLKFYAAFSREVIRSATI